MSKPSSISAPEIGPKFFNRFQSSTEEGSFSGYVRSLADTLKSGLIDLNITAGFGFCIGRAKEDGPVVLTTELETSLGGSLRSLYMQPWKMDKGP
ncbi:hypothetical protein C5167_035545 [Papaver somniferum]|uniref:Uncharacterized protein n=1 Tax=Papaver somniferum TaxID=3469 RepID=A0A4Y7KG82_PAPSO|nr:hypothetical protein C5167_035545 [Papaver somniferum]